MERVLLVNILTEVIKKRVEKRMAKYDEFGRPIYETAEEYNKAHKTGGSSRTYDSPEGNAYKHNPIKINKRYQNTTTQYGKRATVKKSKTVMLCVIICTMTFCIGFVFSVFNEVRSSYQDVYDDWVVAEPDISDDVDSYDEYLGEDTSPLPEGFETFSYNGQTYTLPTTFEEIDKMGFTLEEEYDENYILPMEYEELLILNDEDGFMSAMVRISNYTEAEIPLGKSLVDYFYIDNPAAYDEMVMVPDFVFGDGLTFESSYEDLEAYFGIPFYHYHEDYEDGNWFDSYEWAYYGEDEIHFVSITFWNDVISNVGIEKKTYEEKY